MSDALPTVLASLLKVDGWTVPVLGLVVGVVAFLSVRHFLLHEPFPNTIVPDSDEPPAVDVFLYGSVVDRRAAPRRRGNAIEVYLSEGTEAPSVLAWVRDRSVGGLCLRVEQAVPEGCVLNVRPCKSPAGTPWLPIEVRSCRQGQGEWELGCQFLRVPSWSELLLFG